MPGKHKDSREEQRTSPLSCPISRRVPRHDASPLLLHDAWHADGGHALRVHDVPPSRGRPPGDAWLRRGDGVLHARDALQQDCGVRWLALTWNLGIPFSRSLSAARSLVPQTCWFVKQ